MANPRTTISLCTLGSIMALCANADPSKQIPATITMIDNDVDPVATPGPGEIASGIVALDYNYRSIFVEFEEKQTISRIVLKSDPATNRGYAGNANLTPDKLELYWSNDNQKFTKLQLNYGEPDDQTVVLDGFEVNTRYLKIHSIFPKGAYMFVNRLGKMVPTFVPPGLKGPGYYELEDPLFEALLSDVPGPKRVLYWTGNCGDELGLNRPWFRAHAKKFGYRYVFEEQLEEAAKHNLICGGKARPELSEHGILTWRFVIGDPGKPFVPSIDGMPMVFGSQGWLMDPRWMDEYFKRAVERAEAKEQWALSAGDETWEVFAINAVPKDKRYDLVLEADKEIKENYGFGKYGMPDSNDDPNPFARIAHRRWVSDKLTELFRKTYKAVKEISQDTIMLAPDFASGAPAADIEAWAPYFDIFPAQCGNSPKPFVNQFCVGCDTKVMVDLAGKPVWMAVQQALPADYGYTVTPEDIRERYSQVFRNGGQGIFLLASEWYERELNHPKYAEPAKWRAMLHVVDMVTNMNQVKRPEADFAILYSSDSLLTLRWAQMNNGDRELYSAYAVLGPLLRGWFHFVSDRQIERGTRDLSDYKVLYIPFAEYERVSVLEKIKAYTNAGGTVVCTDPEAFTWNISGESLAQKWEALSGVRKVGERKGDLAVRTVESDFIPLHKQISFPLLAPAWKIVPASDNVKPIAVFKDGSPAITLHRYGEGKVIFFAAEPYAVRGGKSLVEPSAPIVTLFEGIQKAVGAQLGHDIWRFKLPQLPTDVYQKEKGLCLTGNYVFDRNEPLLEENNLDTGGTYTYSRFPTEIPDSGETGQAIPFTEGHLTNRVAAYRNRNKHFAWDVTKTSEVTKDWIVSWVDAARVTITFDLKSEYPLKRVRLFYSSTLPALEVSGSTDGATWKPIGAISQQAAGKDVKDAALPLEGTYRYVMLDFAAGEKGKNLELCEVEVWGGTFR